MDTRYAAIAFTPGVQAEQIRQGSRRAYEHGYGEATAGSFGPLDDPEMSFLAERDSFFMATTNSNGWPYVQHRGGPAGFVKVLDDRTIAFADFRGNRQYISVGNAANDDRVALIFVDYLHKVRLKIFGRVRVSEDPELVAKLMPDNYRAVPERAMVIDVEATSWNCQKHIPQMIPAQAVVDTVGRLKEEIARLAAENAELRAR
ncbi:MAG: pyridoxamine 5'-phosphate oxidase family protein [Nocardiaceae bacterium]|nr:pyridoxamine 5'-phosphate oxidase family protein [Nocardiaceae bacterium]